MNVLLIGNAPESIIPPLEDYDQVIRMNKGGIEQDCDLWVNNLRYFTPQPDTDKKILRLNYMKGGKQATDYPKNWEVNTTHWTCREYEMMCLYLKLYKPSTGMMAIYYLVENTDYTIDVAGFTHEGFEVHNWERERYTLDGYESKNLINKIWREDEVSRTV